MTDDKLYPIDPVVIVDNNKSFTDRVEEDLRQKAITHIKVCKDGSTLKSLGEIDNYSFILLNMSIPGIEGKGVVKILEEFPKIPIILIGNESRETVVKYMQQRALYYYENGKINHNELINKIYQGISLYESIKPIITRAKEMCKVFKLIKQEAQRNTNILLIGEVGVGKARVAKAIHTMSGRKGKFIRVNITGLDDDHFTVKLFGQLKNTTFGDEDDCIGLIEEAHGGTLFMHDIGDLSQKCQEKILRLLQEGSYYKVGSTKEIKSEVRFIFAVNKNIENDFRYRAKCFPIKIPPLRERKEDIPLLVDFFIKEALKEKDIKKPNSADAEFINKLSKRSFKGNINELYELIHTLVIGSNDEKLTAKMLDGENNKEFDLEDTVKTIIQNVEAKLSSLKMQTYKRLTVFFADLAGSTSGKTVFEEIMNAVTAAVVFRDSLAKINVEDTHPMKSRITLTYGEVEELEIDGVYDIGGHEVDKAARLKERALPGQILADYRLKENTELSFENSFIKTREINNGTWIEFEGLKGPVKIIEITT
ncbi:MAG: sigma 54-interacting transcriptional regulator [Acidobacteria bacterium]|nr:sigma 54-interacting transcriptional regulator [Acidobacteriota bacterium]